MSNHEQESDKADDDCKRRAETDVGDAEKTVAKSIDHAENGVDAGMSESTVALAQPRPMKPTFEGEDIV